MEFVPVLAMLALVKKLIDFFKYATNGDKNGLLTTGLAWVSGVVAVVLFAQTDFADGIQIGDAALAALNFASQVAVGLTIGSGAGLTADFLSAKRPSDDPARLKLLPSATKAEARRRTRGDEGHLDWQTALLAAAVAVIVYLVMAKVFEVGVG